MVFYRFSLFCLTPSFFFSFPLWEKAWRKDLPRWSIRDEHVVCRAEGDWFCFPERFTGCLTTYISLYFLTVDNHRYFFIIFCQFGLTSGLFPLLTLTLSAPLSSLASSLMAHRAIIQLMWSDTGEHFPMVGLQLPPTLNEPLFLMLLMLHIIKFRIMQFSCSSPCSKLYKSCFLSIHCSQAQNQNKWVLQPNDRFFLP